MEPNSLVYPWRMHWKLKWRFPFTFLVSCTADQLKNWITILFAPSTLIYGIVPTQHLEFWRHFVSECQILWKMFWGITVLCFLHHYWIYLLHGYFNAFIKWTWSGFSMTIHLEVLDCHCPSVSQPRDTESLADGSTKATLPLILPLVAFFALVQSCQWNCQSVKLSVSQENRSRNG